MYLDDMSRCTCIKHFIDILLITARDLISINWWSKKICISFVMKLYHVIKGKLYLLLYIMIFSIYNDI